MMQGLPERIETARRRTLAWLDAMQAPGLPRGVSRISAAHDAERWPGVLLPGTYNAVMCRALIGGLDGFSAADRGALVAWLESHRLADGRFRIPGMRDEDVFKKPDPVETWGYIDFHVTNYSLGAIEALDPARRPKLDFARRFLDPQPLLAWLALRDLRDPWQEGNNIVNLGSFLLGLMAEDATRADRALQLMFDWHDRLQEPATGFWGVNQAHDARALLHAFAGSMHNFHLWYETRRVLPYQARAMDYVLTLPPVIDSACIDVDAVDLLVHGLALTGHRDADVRAWCAALLPRLLDWQEDDGGFCDIRDGVRRQDGWVRGYEEPQGFSNTFATFFRWIAIAMIADLFWPRRWPWRFRRMVGIGYRMPMSGRPRAEAPKATSTEGVNRT
ncbi:hypothetical protein [Falsiroseomonas sp. HW251]|uniref:hypothetical protein n=1 Tax=Falsiroseomonas sp. HW251 TaxID=3390998 RepID=UPI003D30F16F